MDSLAKLERAMQVLAEAKTMDDIFYVADLAEAAKAERNPGARNDTKLWR